VKWVFPDETANTMSLFTVQQRFQAILAGTLLRNSDFFISELFSPCGLLLCQIAVLNPKKILLALHVWIGNSRLPVPVIS